MRSIARLVIHCSATPNGVWIAPEQIDSWHQERGFRRDPQAAAKFRPHLPHIAYHRVIEPDGSIEFARDVEEGSLNEGSVSVCMVGTNAFFGAQWAALKECICILALKLAQRVDHVIQWEGRTVISPEGAASILRAIGVEVIGHRDLGPLEASLETSSAKRWGEWLRTCPGFDVRAWMERGMEPEAVNLLDGHPAIAQAEAIARVMSSMRYGAL